MGLKRLTGTTPQRRFMTGLDFSSLTRQRPAKNLSAILKKHGGRSSNGQVSVRHQGGRQKRFYRQIDFKRDKRNIKAYVASIEYDPNRTANIALLHYADGEKRYILAPIGLKTGEQIMASVNAEIKPGNSLSLAQMPVGTFVHNVEIVPGLGGQIVRGAGTSAVVLSKEEKFVQLKMPSGEIRKVLGICFATVGQLSNEEWKNIHLGKAGRKRHMGIRPKVRGTAQDPRSHPHGGGEGRSGEGMNPKTPWGKPARGVKTRKKKKYRIT
ncbi:MAG: 50S ribosomal protein L2, partial [Patescibacteria group bacterium]|nr:50S ribosomal protein L2 [Patescibacteria group bacterium]